MTCMPLGMMRVGVMRLLPRILASLERRTSMKLLAIDGLKAFGIALAMMAPSIAILVAAATYIGVI